MNKEELIEKAKKTSTKEACAYSLMDGFGFRYITPYALSVGANNFHIGLLSSIPSLLGNLSQLLTLKAMDKWKRKTIVFWGVFLQAIMWIFLLGAGFLYFNLNIKTALPSYFLISVYTLLILFGSFSGPAWTSWMKDLVTKDRGTYFAKRGRLAGAIAIICMLIAGFILDYFKQTHLFMGFIILFSLAFIGRLISSLLMLKQYEPEFKQEKKYYFSFFQFARKMAFNNFGRFVIYFSLISFSASIASPFFAVFMLKDLHLSYVNYMMILLANSLSSILFMPLWGKFADKYGNMKVMHLTSPLTSAIPILYFLSFFFYVLWPSQIMFYLITLEIISGIIWAGLNLAAGNFIYDAVTRERTAICSSYFNILNGFGTVIGALLGGWMASSNLSILGLSSLLIIFFLSGIVRLAVYFIMDKKVHEVRPVEYLDFKHKINNFFHSISFHKFSESHDSMTKLRPI